MKWPAIMNLQTTQSGQLLKKSSGSTDDSRDLWSWTKEKLLCITSLGLNTTSDGRDLMSKKGDLKNEKAVVFCIFFFFFPFPKTMMTESSTVMPVHDETVKLTKPKGNYRKKKKR